MRTFRRESMAPYLLIAAFLPAAAFTQARAEIAASLAASDEAAPAAQPFQPAKLTIDATEASEGQVVRAVSLREVRGGPRLVYSTTVAAGTKQTLPVALPAVSQEQRYRIELLAEDAYPAPVLAEAVAPIRWSADQLADLAFLDPQAYDPWKDEPPLWTAALRRNVFIALVVAALAGMAAMLVRRPGARAAVVVAIAAAATVWLTYSLGKTETIVQREADDGSLLVLQCRRTGVWRTSETRLVPIYVNRWHLSQDNMILHVGKETRLELSPRREPDRLRIFRRRKPPSG